ncbi:MAG: hypothetical protein KGO51_11890 [Alphaproteobacteria bacterium]|nr:hypothetical protein [Alphaproteobacteria bacterium]
MTISGVTSTPTANVQTPQVANFRSTFQQLAKAISSGDLSSAQSAYAELSQMQGAQQGNGPFAELLSSLGKDLSSGDLSTAQTDLAAFQKAHGGHHHHRAGGDGDHGVESSSTSASTTSETTGAIDTTNGLDITA